MSEAASTQCHISPLTTHNTLWQKTKKNPQLDITPTGDFPFLF